MLSKVTTQNWHFAASPCLRGSTFTSHFAGQGGGMGLRRYDDFINKSDAFSGYGYVSY